MCLIIAPGKNGEKALLPRDIFDYVYGRNNDGFGAMWTEDGQVKHFKTLNLTADEIYAQMEEHTERHPDIIFHMRYKTHGKVIPGLSHPFRILHRSRHGRDLFFMHNGVLSSFGNNLSHGQSDTTVFKDKILVPLLTRNPDALDDPEIFSSIEKLTAGSRLVFMDSTGKTWYTHRSSWNNRFDLTLSNEYMLPSEYAVRQMRGEFDKPSATHNVVTLGSPPEDNEFDKQFKDFNVFSIIRSVRFASGNVQMMRCKFEGYKHVRTHNGLLLCDHGPGVEIDFSKDYIPKSLEHEVLPGRSIVDAMNQDTTPFEDDVLTPEMFDRHGDVDETEDMEAPAEETVGDKVVSMDAKLRYARLVHNTHSNQVANRTQLLADLLGMDTDEMLGLIKEDPETSHVIMEELVEIIFSMNDVLMYSDEVSEYAFDPDEVVARGVYSYHQQAMKDISAGRRAIYEAKLQQELDKEAKESADSVKETLKRVDEAHARAYPEDAASVDVKKAV